MRACALLLLLACTQPPAPTPQLPTTGVQTCPPSLSSTLSQLAVIEPGRQSFQTELFGLRQCADAGPIPPESVAVSVTTEAGLDVLRQARVDIAPATAQGTFGRATIDLELEVPRDAGRVMFAFTVEPTIGVIRHAVPVVTLVEPPFTKRSAAQCAAVVPWRTGRAVCLQYDEALFLDDDGGVTTLGRSSALAITPAGLWSVSTGDVRFFPSDGGVLTVWPQRSQPRAIATLGERVFLGADEGLAELTVDRPARFARLGVPSIAPPSALRVEEPDLIVARQERTDRVPLASLPDSVPPLPAATHITALNLNATAGLWRVEGHRIELATDAGVLRLDVPHELTTASDVPVSPLSPAITDETPLVRLGATVNQRAVWLQPLEDLDAGTLTVRYLVAPPGLVLGRATSEHLFASGAGGVVWAPRR